MDIPLTPELEGFIRERVESGAYASSGEVVRDALLLLKERGHVREQRLEELRREIRKGIDSGPAVPFDPEDLKRRIRAKLAEQSRQE
jgi:antitoxin ParD1/3/4